MCFDPISTAEDVEIIQRPILKGGRRLRQVVLIALHPGHRDRASGEPGTLQLLRAYRHASKAPMPVG